MCLSDSDADGDTHGNSDSLSNGNSKSHCHTKTYTQASPDTSASADSAPVKEFVVSESPEISPRALWAILDHSIHHLPSHARRHGHFGLVTGLLRVSA